MDPVVLEVFEPIFEWDEKKSKGMAISRWLDLPIYIQNENILRELIFFENIFTIH